MFSRLPRLHTLHLQGNHFTDAGLAHLTKMQQLKELWIGTDFPGISDAGVAQLANLKNLEILELQGLQVSNETLASLKALPKLTRIIYRPDGKKGVIDERRNSPRGQWWKK